MLLDRRLVLVVSCSLVEEFSFDDFRISFEVLYEIVM